MSRPRKKKEYKNNRKVIARNREGNEIKMFFACNFNAVSSFVFASFKLRIVKNIPFEYVLFLADVFANELVFRRSTLRLFTHKTLQPIKGFF